MKNLLTSIIVFIRLTKAGFFFSENIHHEILSGGGNKGGTKGLWGFYRLNYSRDGKVEYSVLDIDFTEYKNEWGYRYHMHGGRQDVTIFKVEKNFLH